jgi:hypothetical protein
MATLRSIGLRDERPRLGAGIGRGENDSASGQKPNLMRTGKGQPTAFPKTKAKSKLPAVL